MPKSDLTQISQQIFSIRSTPIMLDADLARLYGVETSHLNRAVTRNKERFPKDFSFKLKKDEWENLMCQIGISSDTHGGRRKLPRVFTEHGALMAATVLRSEQANKMSLFIIRAFTKMREEIATNHKILKKLAEIDSTLITHDSALRDVYKKILPLLSPPPDPPKREIGFHQH